MHPFCAKRRPGNILITNTSTAIGTIVTISLVFKLVSLNIGIFGNGADLTFWYIQSM